MKNDHQDHEDMDTEEQSHHLAEDTSAADDTQPKHHEELTEETVAANDDQPKSAHQDAKPKSNFDNPWRWIVGHKMWTIPAAVVIVVAALAAIPFTRYALAGLVLKRDFSIRVVDAETKKPVTDVTVMLGQAKASTNNEGVVKLRVAVGKTALKLSKKYYKDASTTVLVPIGKQQQPYEMQFEATGRAVPITVQNAVTKKPVANISITAADTETTTDKTGKALLVLPPAEKTVKATLKATGFTDKEVTVTVSVDELSENTFTLTPAGKIYFLSNQTGKIDVVKTNLDGTGREIVLAGTGKEIKNETTLLASLDWKYLALYSKRDGGDNAKLFLIDTGNGQLTTMDEGDADFSSVGWSGHSFIYQVNRKNVGDYQPKRQSIKSFNAETKKIKVLADTEAAGTSAYDYFSQYFSFVAVLGDEVFYATSYSAQPSASWQDKQASVTTIKPDGSGKKILATYKDSGSANPQSLNEFISARTYGANEVYFTVTSEQNKLFEYSNGVVKTLGDKKADNLYDEYYTYLVSPNKDKTFWAENRDGRNTLFVGNIEGEDAKKITTKDDYNTYGWFTNDYLLLSKNGSELYIVAADAPADITDPLKVTDYFRPGQSFYGYGYGYGGI